MRVAGRGALLLARCGRSDSAPVPVTLFAVTVASLLINTLMNSINVNMQVWAEDKTPEASGVIHNTLGLWQECAQVEGAGEVCADSEMARARSLPVPACTLPPLAQSLPLL